MRASLFSCAVVPRGPGLFLADSESRWGWWVNHVMGKELCPDWLNYLQGWFRKVISFNHSDQKVITFGTPTLPFIKTPTSLSLTSLPWLLPLMSILSSPLKSRPKVAAAGKRGKKTKTISRPAANSIYPQKKYCFSSSSDQRVFIFVSGLILAREHTRGKSTTQMLSDFTWFRIQEETGTEILILPFSCGLKPTVYSGVMTSRILSSK